MLDNKKLLWKRNLTFTLHKNSRIIRIKIVVSYRTNRYLFKRWKSKFNVVKRMANRLTNWKCTTSDNLVEEADLLKYIIENSNWFLFKKAEDFGIVEFKSG